MRPLRAAILDFDGLVLETEGCCFASWRALFRDHGAEYTLEEYLRVVGTVHTPRELFEDRCGPPADWAGLEARRRALEDQLGLELRPLPGVVSLLEQARALGMGVAVASSSTHRWVERHLGRHGLLDRFDTIVCREDVPRAKPEPDLYLEALRRLGAGPAEAVAFEDSATGSLAATRAGIRCVAVPTPITRTQDFSHADRILPTLEGLDLGRLLVDFSGEGR